MKVHAVCGDETLHGSNLPVSAKNPINKAASIRQKLLLPKNLMPM